MTLLMFYIAIGFIVATFGCMDKEFLVYPWYIVVITWVICFTIWPFIVFCIICNNISRVK